MNMSAGAPCSICLIRVLLAAYEMTTFLPLSRCHCAATSSSAFFKLAAANISGSLACAHAGAPAAPSPSTAPIMRPIEPRLFTLIGVLPLKAAMFGGNSGDHSRDRDEINGVATTHELSAIGLRLLAIPVLQGLIGTAKKAKAFRARNAEFPGIWVFGYFRSLRR